MSDYKDRIQARAEDIAANEYGCDFYELSSETQDLVYRRANGEVNESYLSAADDARKRRQEAGRP